MPWYPAHFKITVTAQDGGWIVALQEGRSMLPHYKGTVLDGGGGGLAGGFGFGLEVGGYAVDDFV